MKSGTIKVDYLARVEGEGSLYIKVKGGAVEEVRLKIFEPPRFFEAFLRGRHYSEASDITSRICGICPVAYQMSAVHAMEDAFGVKVDGQLRALRRLIYCVPRGFSGPRSSISSSWIAAARLWPARRRRSTSATTGRS